MTEFNKLTDPCLMETAQSPGAIVGGAASSPAVQGGLKGFLGTIGRAGVKAVKGVAGFAGDVRREYKKASMGLRGGISAATANDLKREYQKAATEIESGTEKLDQINKVLSRVDGEGTLQGSMDNVDNSLRDYADNFRSVVKYAAGDRDYNDNEDQPMKRERLLKKRERKAETEKPTNQANQASNEVSPDELDW